MEEHIESSPRNSIANPSHSLDDFPRGINLQQRMGSDRHDQWQGLYVRLGQVFLQSCDGWLFTRSAVFAANEAEDPRV
jgi:hypothetical protein